MNGTNEIKKKDQKSEIFLFCKPSITSSFTFVNWINKLQEMVEYSEKTIARFKRCK